MNDDERQRALDRARWLMGREDASDRETLVAQGLIAVRAEADRLGSLLDDVRGFLAQHALAADPRNVIANALLHIDTHRRAK